LLHPLFKIENLVVKSALDVQNYEKSYYRKDDGWQLQEIEGYKLHHCDSIIALETFFLSPRNAENFVIKPINQYNVIGERIYSTPATGKWWHFMQVSCSTSLLVLYFLSIIRRYICNYYILFLKL
jgi:hypothetical protein